VATSRLYIMEALYSMNQGKEVLMVAKGQEEGVVLCDWQGQFVTWKIYRHDDWRNTAHGRYFLFSYEKDKALQYEKARNDFFARVLSIK
jgi:hypothetical protein